jgi:hypothetical protein
MWSCSMNRRAALRAVDRTANSEASAAAACFESAAAVHPGREAAAASARCLAAAAKTGATAKTCGSPPKNARPGSSIADYAHENSLSRPEREFSPANK